tara:strand:+ start:4494 stop:4778 length:285 start_codon:yes stop_codon:yes gene_type:complete
MSFTNIRYKNVEEKNETGEIFFLDIHPGGITDFFDDTFNYIINILSGQIRIISEGKNSELFQFAKKSLEIESGEKFQVQNVSCNNMKLLIVKYK